MITNRTVSGVPICCVPRSHQSLWYQSRYSDFLVFGSGIASLTGGAWSDFWARNPDASSNYCSIFRSSLCWSLRIDVLLKTRALRGPWAAERARQERKFYAPWKGATLLPSRFFTPRYICSRYFGWLKDKTSLSDQLTATNSCEHANDRD